MRLQQEISTKIWEIFSLRVPKMSKFSPSKGRLSSIGSDMPVNSQTQYPRGSLIILPLYFQLLVCYFHFRGQGPSRDVALCLYALILKNNQILLHIRVKNFCLKACIKNKQNKVFARIQKCPDRIKFGFSAFLKKTIYLLCKYILRNSSQRKPFLFGTV